MKIQTKITELLNIDLPIIQAGMVWCSGWKLASAVSNAGGLGVIGAGSMSVDILEEHIIKCKSATNKPFAVNLPLLYKHIDQQIDLIIKHKVPVVITSAGNPSTYTSIFKEAGITVIHVVSSTKFALKAQAAGVDAIVAEGFEAGGHNGRDETTTLCLLQEVVNAVNIPVIAAGGIGSGNAILAALSLGAEAVQIGTLFAACEESSANDNFKQALIHAKEGDTKLVMKQITPVRLLKNAFFEQIDKAESEGKTIEELKEILGKGRAKKGIFEGDLIDGELEIGQITTKINKILSARELINQLLQEFDLSLQKIKHLPVIY
ncbi:MAG: hypothetical protein RLZZ175_2582 [Bacteroidota bacterium]|jgi:enoyl-[acyl-carrier protein] reductase II